jgi:hypothetical protein
LVGSMSFMRLSLRKAAHAVLSTTAQQEIRVRSGRDDKGYGGVFCPGRILVERTAVANAPLLLQDFLQSITTISSAFYHT